MQQREAGAWLAALLAALGGVAALRGALKPGRGGADQPPPAPLERLHVKYLGLHAVVRLADWLQGTNMYTLYTSYGVDAGLLFFVGFATSAVCSTVLGHWVDKHGRKRACLLYCALEAGIQLCEHVPDIRVLLLGRVLGGVSTALMYGAFESWIVTAHRARGFPEAALERMFSLASIINGATAVVAGLLARLAFAWGGEIAPFQLALVLSCVAGVWIAVDWVENRAEDHAALRLDLSAFRDKAVLALALVQAGFDAAMFVFVFMWVGTLLDLAGPAAARPPVEIIFSCLMVALSAGGLLFDLFSTGPLALPRDALGALICAVAAVAMLAAAAAAAGAPLPMSGTSVAMLAFCVFEACVGMFDPWVATMRSRHVPERVLATVMTLARVPLNVLVGMGVHLSETRGLVPAYTACATLLAACAAACVAAPWRRGEADARKDK